MTTFTKDDEEVIEFFQTFDRVEEDTTLDDELDHITNMCAES